MLDPDAPLDGGGLDLCEQPGHINDLLLRHPGNLLADLRRVLFQAFTKLVEPRCIVLNKMAVIEVFLDHHMHHGHGKRDVRTGPEL